MFHRYLAAALLLPASFAVHGSLRVWLKTIRMGKHAFFSQVIKKGSATPLRAPCWSIIP